MMIKLLGFAPDVDPRTEGVIVECSNMVPFARGFKTAPSMADVGYAALSSACKGAALLLKLDGSYRLVAGEATKLSSGASLTWTDVSRTSGGAYSLGSTDRWRFAQFGEVSLAAAKSETLQYWSSGTDFENVTGAPSADLIETVNGFVMLANTTDGTYGDQKHRWWSSGIYDHTTWTPALSTQCTTGLLVDVPGRITALKRLGSHCVAYKKNGIFVGSYVGPPLVWAWSVANGGVGVDSNECVVSIGSAHFFIGRDDIYLFDGSVPVPIGNEVKTWFFNDLDKAYQYKIIGLHDREESNVMWFYPSASGADGTLDSVLIYNYKYKRWGHATYSIESAVEVVSDIITYETFGSIYTTYDDTPEIAYDSPFWQAAAPVLGAFDTTHTLNTITGAGGTMSIKTGIMGHEQQVSLLRRVIPRFSDDPTSGTMTNYYEMETGEDMTEDQTVSMSENRFDVLRSARWHQLKFTLVGDCEISGAEVDAQGAGRE